MAQKRPMLIFASDIHLTDELKGPAVPWVEMFSRFWTRIESSRGEAPAHLVFVGDLFDLVRSPKWLETDLRPYQDPGVKLAKLVEEIVDTILEREAPFFDAVRSHVQSGKLNIHYALGNHDRLLNHCPAARRKIWKAFTGEEKRKAFPDHLVFPDHNVLAYHGHVADFICSRGEGQAPIGDAIGCDLILRFPERVRHEVGFDVEELDDIDDVRPIYAVPAWVRQIGSQHKKLLRPIQKTWASLVEEFLDNPFVQGWMHDHRKAFGFDPGKKLKLLLELSTGKIMAKTHDHRLTQLYKVFQHSFDGRLVKSGAERLKATEHKGLRYVVNGHSHFPSMVPLGHIDKKPAAYFNTGTWRTVHQIAHHLGGRPTFLPYHAMSYLVFFPDGDRLGRDYEWWTGGMVSRAEAHPS
jgi:UDP-2,3-diacylglucosamine pyrophosphatase LpxH